MAAFRRLADFLISISSSPTLYRPHLKLIQAAIKIMAINIRLRARMIRADRGAMAQAAVEMKYPLLKRE